MPNIFVISDTHFSHKNIIVFTDKDGKKIRPYSSLEEMNEDMVKKWNQTVNHDDIVYHLGDVAFQVATSLSILNRLNGKKRLALGNHDHASLDKYSEYFEKIHSIYLIDDIIMSHYPLHPSILSEERYSVNVHGHIHQKDINDPRYLCVSVEHTDYRPVELSDIKQRIKEKSNRVLLKKGASEAYA